MAFLSQPSLQEGSLMMPLVSCSPHPVKPMRSTPAPESPRKETARLASSPSRGQITGQEQLTPMSAISGSFAASVVPLEKMEPKQVRRWLGHRGQTCS